MAAGEAILEIRDLSLEFPTYRGAVRALTGVSLSVRDGEIVGLVGESGCGKSVTAMCALGLLPRRGWRRTGGTVRLAGREVLDLDEAALAEIRGRTAAMVFQEPLHALNPTFRIGRQIAQVIRRHDGVGRAEALRAAAALLAEMAVPDPERVLAAYPFELSGGMRQRVMIALAFSCRPRLLIADEPTTALDVTVQAQILALIRARARARGTAVLFISHDMAVVAQLSDRLYVMYAGRIVESGPTRRVLGAPAHPYTRALLAALPEGRPAKSRLAAIPGAVPNLLDPPAGCPFRPRCGVADAQCAEMPALLAAGAPGHRAACWRPMPEGGGAAAARPADAAP